MQRSVKMFRFEYPLAFALLLLIPLYYIARAYRILLPQSFLLTLSDWNGESFEATSSNIFLRIISRICLVASFVTLVSALASPVISQQERIYTSRGAEMVFALDISPSMTAKDMDSLSRLESAKQTIQHIVSINTGTSFGLTALAAEAVMYVPPTLDHAFLMQRVNNLAAGELGDGTALGTGIATAVYHLRNSNAPKKSIIILTDGENNAGSIHPLTAAELAIENNIRVFVVGIGTQGKTQLEYVDPTTGKVYSGQYDSSYNADNLKELATVAQGTFFTAVNIAELISALQQISNDASVEQSYIVQSAEIYYYTHLVLVTLILASLAWVIRRLLLRELL